MITVAPSRAGVSYAETATIRIHSSYDPVKEASRFVHSNITAYPSVVLLLGPGLNYLQTIIREKFPKTRVFSIYYDKFFFDAAGENSDSSWFPEAEETLSSFLHREIDEYSFNGLLILEWPPSAAAFSKISRFVNGEIGQFAREINGSIFATAAFGRRWFVNAVINYVIPEYFYEFIPGDKPIVIAASGPTLPLSFPVLKQFRENFSLWSLPSSLLSLSVEGIIPDIIISTDAGFYSSYHFYPCAQLPEIPVAMPLTALSVTGLIHNPIVPLTQSTTAERLLFLNSGMDAKPIISHGTVAGSALDLALRSGTESIVFAGFDCCYMDLQEHARPHSFDILLSAASNRLSPEYSILFQRAQGLTTRYDISNKIRTSPALETYSGWFNSRTPGSGETALYRIHPSPIDIRTFTPLNDHGFSELMRRNPGKRTIRSDSVRKLHHHGREIRREHVSALLSRLINSAEILSDTIQSSRSVSTFLDARDLFPLLSSVFVPESREIVTLIRDTGPGDKRAVQLTADILSSGLSLFTVLKEKVEQL